MEESKQWEENISDAIARAQLQKLSLEIEGMRNKSKWDDRVARYIPLITTLVAVIGLSLSVWQSHLAQQKVYLEQERERLNKIQSVLRADKEQLLEFIKDDKITATRMVFLLGDLNSVIEQLPQPESERAGVTDLLVNLVKDCNFNDPRHINFDIQAMQHWPGYSDYWKRNIEAHNDLFNRYRAALLTLHDEDPPYFETIEYANGYYKLKAKTEASRTLRFVKLVEGYRLHLRTLEQLEDKENWARQVEGFNLALKNPSLTKKLFQSKTG
jgi:hypothetical protein